MDESGVHDDTPVIAVGAYVGRPRQWQDWTKRWNATKRPIKIYHATDAANLHGEFEGWTAEERDTLVKKLLPVIADTDMPGVVVGIHMHEFEKAMVGRDDLRPIFGTPYAACFQWVVQIIMNFALGALSTERIAFVHELNDYRQEALESGSSGMATRSATSSAWNSSRRRITSRCKPPTFWLTKATNAFGIRAARNAGRGRLSTRTRAASSRPAMAVRTWSILLTGSRKSATADLARSTSVPAGNALLRRLVLVRAPRSNNPCEGKRPAAGGCLRNVLILDLSTHNQRIEEMNRRAAERAHDHLKDTELQLIEASTRDAQEAVKVALAINGGAAIAVLAFIATLGSRNGDMLRKLIPVTPSRAITSHGLAKVGSTAAGGSWSASSRTSGLDGC